MQKRVRQTLSRRGSWRSDPDKRALADARVAPRRAPRLPPRASPLRVTATEPHRSPLCYSQLNVECIEL